MISKQIDNLFTQTYVFATGPGEIRSTFGQRKIEGCLEYLLNLLPTFRGHKAINFYFGGRKSSEGGRALLFNSHRLTRVILDEGQQKIKATRSENVRKELLGRRPATNVVSTTNQDDAAQAGKSSVRSPTVREGQLRELPSLTVGLLTLTASALSVIPNSF
jgi:hypothetical protein